MLYGLAYLSSVTDVLSFGTKDSFHKNYIRGLSPTLLCLREKGLLRQAPPLDFLVHPHQLGDHVLVRTWKENKLEPAWKGHFLVLLTMEIAVWSEERGWIHHKQVNKASPPNQKEQWAVLSLPGNTKVTIKRL
jgi:hypothetical protein